ncbi:MAG: DNA polymerase III subunit beta [Firmicutes bacterium]|nr:DNA polymerase III subunit beta [Bacillota bacterium]
MKFSCEQQALSKALNIVSKAVTSRTTIPILKGILLKVSEDGKLTMSASDLDLSIEKTLKVENYQPGEIVVYAKLFGDIIRKLPNAMVTMELIDEEVKINCANSEFHIIGLPADEFPTINMPEDTSDLILFDKDILKDMIRKTSFAASIDEARGVITGVLVEMQEKSLNMIALDGFRMAISREEMLNKERESIVIPAKILGEISKIIGEADTEANDQVSLYINEKRAIFIIEDIKIVLRLLEGEFVKYRDIIPKNNEIRVVVNRSDFLNSIERASLLAKVGKNNLIKLSITDNSMEITSKSEEGNVREEVMISKEGNDLIIGFNSKYLMDVLKVIEEEEIVMLFHTSISPCLVQPMDGNQFEYLILPVRITNN